MKKLLFPSVAMTLLSCQVALAQFTLVRDEASGTALVSEGDDPVLVYNYGDQLAEGVAADRTRSCYVHPLFGLDGEIITDDFPRDHLHHRGVSMMWPRMRVGDQQVDHWHLDGIRTLNKNLTLVELADGAQLVADNTWTLDSGSTAATEQTKWHIHTAGVRGRIIDVQTTITAGNEPITLQGAVLPKGYGGHMIRLAPRTGERITTDRGDHTRDSDRLPFRWADYSATFQGADSVSGVAMFPHPDYPDYAPSWQLRPYGILSISWPGSWPYVIMPGESLELSYRMWVHRGNAETGGVSEAWMEYMGTPGLDRMTPTTNRMELFKDETIDWTLVGTATYARTQGQLHGHGDEPRNSFLVGPEIFDFELETEILAEPGSNSGIQVRSRVTTDGKAVRGYQVEIDTSERSWTGGLYDELRRGWLESLDGNEVARGAWMPGKWNHMRIIAEGTHFQTWVNGIPCIDAHDAMDLGGILAFQVHGGQCDVRWKNTTLTHLGRHAWKPLFNGRTLEGWRRAGGGDWTVENGILTGRIQADEPRHGHLFTAGSHDDFTVRLEFMSPRGNSGVYFRAQETGQHGIKGFQAEVDGRSGKTGGLYETGGRQWVVPSPENTASFEDAYRPGEWNWMTITARGPRIVVHVNGKKTADIVDPEGRRKGPLALQLHGNQDMEVRFRTIELLEAAPGTVTANGVASGHAD